MRVSEAIRQYEEQARNYLSEVAQELVPGAELVHKFGQDHDIDSAEYTPIWSQGGAYTYMAAAAALFISSSDDADDQDITVIGLDADWNRQTVTQTLAGNTETEIGSGKTWLRVYRAFNADSTDLAGDVYIYEDDTVTAGVPQTPAKIKAKIDIGDGQTQMCLMPVALGKVGRIWRFGGSILSGGTTPVAAAAIDIKIRTREFGKTFRVRENLGLTVNGTNNDDLTFMPYLIVPAKTDIELTGLASDDDTDVAGRFVVTIEDAG